VIFLIAFFPTKECRATHIDEMAGTTNKTKVGGQSADGGVSAWHTTNKFVNKCGIRWPTLLLCACVWVGVFIRGVVCEEEHTQQTISATNVHRSCGWGTSNDDSCALIFSH